ncbi:MAG TPA: acyl-CoA dehydrogenase family protein [Gemmatales bacterium]|nr:acyl-CoA dehydrogenase family protein [Gemmatales bacterium]
MSASQARAFDVVIVGAGCAGISAAIGLAKAGYQVAVVEAAVFAGAENWSGCVYFCENLADPELLGPEGVEALAWERRLVQRGTYLGNGSSLLGVTYRDPQAFRHCYTVLRPIFDHHLAVLAQKLGVVMLHSTTAESLIRVDGRVRGVATQRGPLYADLVFLAEGDASHLVTREGYERLAPGQRQPTFLHGIKQVIDMPPELVERNFGLRPGEGAACEIILRNARLHGQELKLNMGGFIYTNHASLSIGLVLPAAHLAEHFAGDPNLLLEWFENLPDLRPWFAGGTRGVFGAKLIRGGGPREFPQMVDHGLAIGGAASGLGIDFPYPNYTGPATRMGLQLVRAVKAIKQRGGDFTADQLQRHYLEPLHATRYWRDAEFLRDWPEYVERTQVFFNKQVDLALGSAHLWTQDRKSGKERWGDWFHFLLTQVGPAEQRALGEDLQHLQTALPATAAFERPPWPILLHDAWLTSLRGFFGRAGQVPGLGDLQLHYSVGGTKLEELPDTIGGAAKRLLRRLRPGIAAAARAIYTNNDTPLPTKIDLALRFALRRVDLVALLSLGWQALRHGWHHRRSWKQLKGHPSHKAPQILDVSPEARRRLAEASPTPDLTPVVPQAAQNWEDRLGRLGYVTAKRTHIHVHWPAELGDFQKPLLADGLWHVCPAHVYEARVSPLGQLQVVVNFENCVKCETCWRTTDLVDWGRDGRHRFIYAVHSAATARLIAAQEQLPVALPRPPARPVPWEKETTDFEARLTSDPTNGEYGVDVGWLARLTRLADQLDCKLAELPEAVTREPRFVDEPRQAYLEALGRYAQRLADAFTQALADSGWEQSPRTVLRDLQRQLAAWLEPTREPFARLADQISGRKHAWAAATARHIQQHHVAAIRHLLTKVQEHWPTSLQAEPTLEPWLGAEAVAAEVALPLVRWRERLDEVWGPYLWRDLDRGTPLTPPQDDLLRELLRTIGSASEPLRRALLAELGRRDPSLGYRAALHHLALALVPHLGSNELAAQAEAWKNGERWAAVVVLDQGAVTDSTFSGEATLLPQADDYLLLAGDAWLVVASKDLGSALTPVKGLGLRGADPRRLEANGIPLPRLRGRGDPKQMQEPYTSLAAENLLAVGLGLADQLTQRSVAHATSRIQFPGLFHDERSRDTIGKFGAVKKMVAEMAANRLVIETLLHQPGAPLSRFAVAAYLLCSAPGSVGYNAGQVFGGTGYSEDDILSKFYRDASAWRFLLPGAAPALAEPRPASPSTESTLRTAADRGFLTGAVAALERHRDTWQNRSTREPHQAEAVVRAHGLLDATEQVILRLHARMEDGWASETESALLDVWLVRLERWLDDLDLLHAGSQSLTLPAAQPPTTEYQRFLSGPIKPLPASVVELGPKDPGFRKAAAYHTGDFLVAPIDVHHPRYVPEMIATDPRLAATDRRYHELIVNHFGPRDGRKYERFIEANHRPDERDLDFCREHGFFRLPIPKALGGAEQLKAEYYSLVMQSNQHADATVSLLIQANTSIGTVPILLARDKDLPKALKEAGPFAQDASLHQDIDGQLASLRLKAEVGDTTNLQTLARQLEERVQPMLKSATLKGCFAGFAKAWKTLARSAAVGDLKQVGSQVMAARTAWQAGCVAAIDLHAELALRLEACDLGLRWIASGQISAFALTEPAAGSDTARVGTRARLCSVPLECEPNGCWRFVPAAGGPPRRLLDARRLEFRPDGVYYRWSDGEPGLIHFDEYDYETDDPTRQRYYVAGQERVHFTDVAVIRERDGGQWYDYWEMTGAKMWITNGRMCGIMALYAKTEQGVTGFIVDRHTEGLIVGKDEEKMGQNGSPTNELALQAVRVPKEAVLGLEGRGQVNALETLNVGRAGLSMSSVSQMRSVQELSAARVEELGRPAWAAWRLERIAAETFIAEATAFFVIGLFEHSAMQSVRIESAAAKMLVGELLHSTIEWAEEIFGRSGQTQQHLIEKRKRDARIVNLYEGTNEIQRFLLAKELATEVMPRWRAATPAQSSDELSLALRNLLAEFRQRVERVVGRYGNASWANPNLQPLVFHLSEATAWLMAAHAVAGRLAWLIGQGETERVAAGQAGFARAIHEVRCRLRWFDAEFERAQAGCYAPTIRAADLLFDAATHQQGHVDVPLSQIDRALSVLVLLEPTVAVVPQPNVRDGQLLEAHWSLTAADQSALEAALRLRDQAPKRVTVTAAVVGGRGLEPLLREVAALAIDVLHLVPNAAAVAPAQAAAALAEAVRGRNDDLILGPAGSASHADGLVTPLVAAALGRGLAGIAASMAVRQSDGGVLLRNMDGQADKGRSLPAVVAVAPGLELRSFTVAGYLAALDRPPTLCPWPQHLDVSPLTWQSAQAGADAGKEQKGPAQLDPPGAAQWLLQALGVTGGSGPEPDAQIEWVDEAGALKLPGGKALVIVGCDEEGRLSGSALASLQAARVVSSAPAVLALVPPLESAQERVAAALRQAGASRVDLVVHEHCTAGSEIRCQLLVELWPTCAETQQLILGETWTEAALARLSQGAPYASRCRSVARTERGLRLGWAAHGGKLAAEQDLPLGAGATLWATLTDDATVAGVEPAAGAAGTGQCHRWQPSLERLFTRADLARLIEEVKSAAGVARLSDAEFIIDVGYGVGNRDGYEGVVEPLERALHQIGVRGVMIGGSRKITEELHVLPVDRQIGQSGVSVNPRILLALGISGAPQHLQYIGSRATIISFNRDAEAPLMTLNQRQPRPVVFPVVGDLFKTVPAFTAALVAGEGAMSGEPTPAASLAVATR